MACKNAFAALLMLSVALLSSCKEGGKAVEGFVIQGEVPLPDGYNVGLCLHTDTAFSVMVAEDSVKDGRFVLKGNLDKPYQGTLMTNNLSIVERNHWPVDSIRWTYNEVFVSNGELAFTGQDEASFRLTGTQVQTDYNDLLAMGDNPPSDSVWQFIDRHPESVVTVWLANQLTDRAYRLTAEQIAHLEQTVKGSPADTARFALFQKKIEAAKKTVKNAPVTDLELIDVKGDTCHLTTVTAELGRRAPAAYILIDFWASWCGICLHSMPAVSALQKQYSDRLRVIAISIDTKEEAWRHSMEQHPHFWPQYKTTPRGYEDFFTKYQVGNGVPYYLLLSPEGRVIGSPSGPEEVEEMIH